MSKLRLIGDFVMRFLFFALAPFLLVFAASLFPVTGAMLQVGLALLIFFGGEAVRKYATRLPLLGKLLANELKFEAYYREHPPRPFLYYVAYPLLFPYWLWNANARAEFLLFKGYTLVSFALLVVSLVTQYLRAFPPELSLHDFLPIAAGTLLAEAVVVLMFLMPIVTSVVHFHQQRWRKRLIVLLVVAIGSLSFAVARLERRRDPIVSFATRSRVRLRTAAASSKAGGAQAHALAAAWTLVVKDKDKQDIDQDGKVEGEPLEAARTALTSFYKNDEAHAFDLWYTRKNKRAVLVLFFQAERAHAPIWLAMTRGSDRKTHVSHDEAQLPANAFNALRKASR